MVNPVNYYVVLGGQTMGPYSVRALEMMAGQKKIDASSQVCPEGNSEWITYGRFLEESASAKSYAVPAAAIAPISSPVDHVTPVSTFPQAGGKENQDMEKLIKRCDGFKTGSVLSGVGLAVIVLSLLALIFSLFSGNSGEVLVSLGYSMIGILSGFCWLAFGYVVRCQSVIVKLLAKISEK